MMATGGAPMNSTERSKQWRLANPEKAKAIRDRYRAKNLDKEKKRHRDYRISNPEKGNARWRQWRIRNYHRNAARVRAWRKLNAWRSSSYALKWLAGSPDRMLASIALSIESCHNLADSNQLTPFEILARREDNHGS